MNYSDRKPNFKREPFRYSKGQEPLMPGKLHLNLAIVSVWKSGSVFVLKLLASHPGVYGRVLNITNSSSSAENINCNFEIQGLKPPFLVFLLH